MRRFARPQQRVCVTDPNHTMHGATGTVARIRLSDDGAWVSMDEALPDHLRRFPVDDPHGRGRHLLLYPEQCTALTSPATTNTDRGEG